MSSRKTALLGVLILLTIGIVFQVATALDVFPTGAEGVTHGASETFNGSQYNPVSTVAEAGNITSIAIDAIGPTRFWQGYYGEITGEIVLEDAVGNTMYNWSSTEPTGQIFATRGNAISWADVVCLADGGAVSIATEQEFYDMESYDMDNINRTFVVEDHPTFYIGEDLMQNCNSTWTFINSLAQTSSFAEILLEDETSGYAIYSTFIENRNDGNSTDPTGFDGATHDFQLMVPENGTANNADVTQYYFYVNIQ
ncbi:MAG: hypothetical protein KKF89_04550 [Nanoarchaeota archaeon]|nr:hypothetical protein [Nanoarchaeota archaeon]MBU1854964.1 hypothetical protein [Nanoarchaeota archaeon]